MFKAPSLKEIIASIHFEIDKFLLEQVLLATGVCVANEVYCFTQTEFCKLKDKESKTERTKSNGASSSETSSSSSSLHGLRLSLTLFSSPSLPLLVFFFFLVFLSCSSLPLVQPTTQILVFVFCNSGVSWESGKCLRVLLLVVTGPIFHRRAFLAAVVYPGNRGFSRQLWLQCIWISKFIKVYEILDNAVDEAQAGFASKIEVVLLADGSVSIADNGRGILTDMHPATKKSALETVLMNAVHFTLHRLMITLRREDTDPEKNHDNEYFYAGGLVEYVRWLNTDNTFVDLSIYEGNPGLSSCPLPIVCQDNVGAPQVPSGDGGEDDDSKLEKLQFVISLVIGFCAGFWGVFGTSAMKRSWRYAYFHFLDKVKDVVLYFVSAIGYLHKRS
ncbi:hypothetical protein Prudu_018976 [Prunus dulcis]|uniref:Uncharacterized protein n=1 Tax=Prunus dulcis TaxID=3755 RepID=A0A4Y1RS42_PRUDU|nr:hypothetical protein Prudu_018976 [Prunus dulcis]